MKKLLSLLLAIAMIATMIPAIALSAVAADDVTHVDVGTDATYKDPTTNVEYTVIDSAAEFLKYDGQTNIILAKDLELGEETISAAIATLADGVIIDGNGYSVTNFTMTGAKENIEFSLFDVVDNATVTIRNITFGASGEEIGFTYSYSGDLSTGDKCGYAGFLFANVVCNATLNNVKIYTEMTSTTAAMMGAIAGRYEGELDMNDVKLYGTITGKNGGVSAQGAFIGRIFGSGDATLENCENHVDVTATGGAGVAGFFGWPNMSGEVSFTNCANYGDVNSNGQQHASGFVGRIGYISGNTYSFTSCVNRGTINGANNTAGFVAYGDAPIAFDDCENYASVTSTASSVGGFVGAVTNNCVPFTAEDCCNYGAITGVGDLAGIVGKFQGGDKSSFSNCANYGIITGSYANVGGLIGLTNVTTENLTLSLESCVNYGTVNQTGNQGVGGCIGVSNSNYKLSVTDCANFGNVKGGQVGGAIGKVQGSGSVNVTTFLNLGNLSSGNPAGGVVGAFNTTTGTYKFDKCVNFGSVSGKEQVGGFVGLLKATLTIENSVNAGTVSPVGDYGNFVGSAGKATDNDNKNNYHVAVAGANTDCTTEDNAKTLAEVMEAFNNGELCKSVYDIWGEVMYNDKGDGIVLATPDFVGVQHTAVVDGEYSIRLISVIDASRYSKVGYNIQVSTATVTGGEGAEYCTTAYTEIVANDNGVKKTYTAAELGGLYVYALKIEHLDPTETYTFTITPIAVGTEEDGAAEYAEETYIITYTKGVYSGAVVKNAEVQL